MIRREREAHKAELLWQIRQQRLDLSSDRKAWLEATAYYDHGWLVLLSAKRWLAVGGGVMAICSVRNPRFIARWVGRGLGAWSIWRRVRNYRSH